MPSRATTAAAAQVGNDAKLMHAQLGLDCRAATVELQSLARAEQLDRDNGVGLQGLALTMLGKHLSKDPRVR